LRDEGFDQVDSGGLEDTMVSSLQRVMVAEANWQPAALPEQSLLQKSPIDAVMDARSTQPDRVAAGSQTVADTRRTPASAEIQALLMEQFAAVLQITADHLDLDAPFSDFGVDSILSVALIRRLNRALSIELRTTDLFNYPSIRQLAEHVLDQFGDSLVIGGDDNNEDVSAVPDASLSDILDRWLISGVLDIEEAERRIMGVINEG
ncbi:MAG TPA: hypothetical protein DDY14_16550, partial [Chromatiaceae bacterium]|nr:hypothetical protein [Chromatiaceae bacterium]